MTTIRRLAVLLTAALLALGFASAPAMAAYPPGGPTLTLSTSQVRLNTTFTIKGAGFKANSVVTVVVGAGSVTLGTPTSDGTGGFVISAKLPCSFASGANTITGNDGTSSASSDITFLACSVNNPPPPNGNGNGKGNGNGNGNGNGHGKSGHGKSGSTTDVASSGSSNGLSFTGVVIIWLLLIALAALIIGTALVRRTRRATQ